MADNASEIEQGFNSLLSEAGLGNPIVSGIASNYIKRNISSVSWLSWAYFRSYFRVNNSYVLGKLRILLLPIFHKKWTRKGVSNSSNDDFDPLTNSGSSSKPEHYLPPTHDINAPDLYLPLMAFITYILLMAYLIGIAGDFNPEIFGTTATSAFVILFLENILIKLFLYLLSAPAAPSVLDCVAYTFYIFIPVNVTLIIDILFGYTAYWIVSVLVGMSMGIFMARSLQTTFVGMDLIKSKRLRPFLMIVGAAQIPLILYLGQSVVIA